MVKAHITKLNPKHLARVGPVGLDEQEVPLHLVYGQVMLAAQTSQEDYTLDTIIDELDQEQGV